MSVKAMDFVWEKAEVAGVDLVALLALADWADAAGHSWAGILTIAKRLRSETRTAQRVLRYLERRHLIIIKPGGGRKTKSGYTNGYWLVMPGINCSSYEDLCQKVGVKPVEPEPSKGKPGGKRASKGVTSLSGLPAAFSTEGVTSLSGHGVTSLSGHGVTNLSGKPSGEPSGEPSVIVPTGDGLHPTGESSEGTPQGQPPLQEMIPGETDNPLPGNPLPEEVPSGVKPEKKGAARRRKYTPEEESRRVGLALEYGAYQLAWVKAGKEWWGALPECRTLALKDLGVYRNATKPLADSDSELTGSELLGVLEWYHGGKPAPTLPLAQTDTILLKLSIYRAVVANLTPPETGQYTERTPLRFIQACFEKEWWRHAYALAKGEPTETLWRVCNMRPDVVKNNLRGLWESDAPARQRLQGTPLGAKLETVLTRQEGN